jgi:hypothetical protein
LWAVAALASLAALFILVLSVPLDLGLHVDIHGKPKLRMMLVWLFGLVSKEIEGKKKKSEEKKRAVEGKRRRREKKRRDIGVIFRVLRTKGLLSQVKRLLTDILRRPRIRKLEADLRIGLDNPADTGFLFALIGPATLFLSSSSPHRIMVQPSFDEAVFEGYLYGMIRLQPVQLIPPFLRLLFSLATIRVLKMLVTTKWKRTN